MFKWDLTSIFQSPVPQPTPPPPPPPVREEWVIRDSVERDPVTQGRIRGSFRSNRC